MMLGNTQTGHYGFIVLKFADFKTINDPIVNIRLQLVSVKKNCFFNQNYLVINSEWQHPNIVKLTTVQGYSLGLFRLQLKQFCNISTVTNVI